MDGSVEGLVVIETPRFLFLLLLQKVWQIRFLSVLDFEVVLSHRCL